MNEDTKTIVVDLPNRQICGVEYSEELVEGYLVVKCSKSVKYEIINKSTGKTEAEFIEHIHFSTKEELVAKINALKKA